MKSLLLAIFCFLSCTTNAQQYLYINTDNLIVRSSPRKLYNVLAVLHPGYRVTIYPPIDGVTKAEQAKFCFVRYLSADKRKQAGFIEKQYLVRSPKLVTAPVMRHNSDTGMNAYCTLVDLPSDNNATNCTLFPYPRYKGGEHSFPVPKKREYHQGPHGGCYFIDGRGRKKYVDRKYCK